jgi:hypothetical protein
MTKIIDIILLIACTALYLMGFSRFIEFMMLMIWFEIIKIRYNTQE